MDVRKFTKKCWGGGMLLAVRANLIFEGQKKGCSFKLQQKPKMVKQLAIGKGGGGGGTCVDVSIAVVQKLLF